MYWPHIDGLRAIAVLAVICFHAAPQWLPGGFAGVDVFFVISGFLITGILLRATGSNRYLGGFYLRRVRRIFPALIAVLAASMCAGWFLLLGDEFQQLTMHVTASAVFVVNFVFLNEAGYFDTAASGKPLLHLWSLAVEEQFYLVWPLLLTWVVSKRWSAVASVGALLGLSFALNVWLVTRHGAAAFFLLPTRTWELMAGAMLCLWTSRTDRHESGGTSRSSDLLALGGLALLIVAFTVLSSERHYPGSWALLPVVGTSCIIMGGREAWINRFVLSRRLLVFVGLISYPLYLWHWPALAFARIVEGQNLHLTTTAMALVLASLLAIATYGWLERPLKRLPLRATAGILAGLMIIVGALGWAGSVGWITARSAGKGIDRFARATRDWDFPGPGARPWTTQTGLRVVSMGSGTRRVLVVGDSNAQQYGPRIAQLVREHPSSNTEVIFATSGGCPPLPGVRRMMSPECEKFIDDVLAYASDRTISDVVFAAQWTGYFDPRSLVLLKDDGGLISGSEAVAPMLVRFGRMVRDLVENKKRVSVILNIPVGPVFDPHYILHRDWHGGFQVRTEGMQRSAWEAQINDTVVRLAKAASDAGAVVIDPADALCAADVCPSVTADGDPLYRDGYHLRASYVKDNVGYLDAVILGNK